MVAPVRLMDGGGDAFERELLASVHRDQVPSESRARVALGLGLTGAAVGASAGTPSGTPTAPSVAASARLASVRVGVPGKLILLGLLGGVALLIGVRQQLQRPTPPPESALVRAAESGAARSPSAEPALPPVAPADLTLPPLPAPVPSPLPTTPRARKLLPLPSAAPTPGPTAKHDRLLAEVAQLDHARSELRAAHGAAALSVLDEYAARYPDGELQLEAAVLRVQALLGSSREAAAQELARRTLAQPGSERYRAELERVLQANPSAR